MQKKEEKQKESVFFFFSCLTVTVGVCVIFHPSFHLLSSWTLLTSLQHSFCLYNPVMGFSYSLGLSQFLSPLQVTLCPLPFPPLTTLTLQSQSFTHTHVCTLTLSLPLAGSVSHCCRYDSEAAEISLGAILFLFNSELNCLCSLPAFN